MNPPAEKVPNESVHKIVDWAIDKQHLVTEAKFKAVDTRVDSVCAEVDRLPNQIENMIRSLRDLVEARVGNVMSEIQTLKSSVANVEATTKTMDDKSDSVRDRLTIIEAKTIASHTTRADSSARTLSWFAIITTIAIGAGTIWTGVQHNDSDKTLYENVNRLQTEHEHLARTTARNPVEKNDVDLLSQRLDALSRRLNTLPAVGGATGVDTKMVPPCPGVSSC